MPKQKLSPLPAAAFQILMSLVDDDLHGYEIMRRVEEQTAAGRGSDPDAVQLHPGAARSRVHRRSLATQCRRDQRRTAPLLPPDRSGTEGRARRSREARGYAARRAREEDPEGRICLTGSSRFLLRLYPEEFRRVYGRDALQLMWDRAGHERGVWLRARLLMDLTRDLVVTSLTWQPAGPGARAHRRHATVRHPRAASTASRAIAAGTLTSMLMLASFALLFQPRVFPPAPAQLGEGSGASRRALNRRLRSAGGRQRVSGGPFHLVAMVADNLRQHYVDRAVGQQLADALLVFEKNGALCAPSRADSSSPIESTTTSTRRAARSAFRPACLWPTSSLFGDRPIPTGPPPPVTGATRERDRLRLLEQNCMFRTIETLPRNIGYVKLDGFMPPFACQETARRARWQAVNNADALIIDLRDNGGGVGRDRTANRELPVRSSGIPLRSAPALAGPVAYRIADRRQQTRRQAGLRADLVANGSRPPNTSSTT